jgi:hypothetical protein
MIEMIETKIGCISTQVVARGDERDAAQTIAVQCLTYPVGSGSSPPASPATSAGNDFAAPGGRPLWQLSLSFHEPGKSMPVPVLRWSATKWRKAEALRDRTMRDVGIGEWAIEDMSHLLGDRAVCVHYRRLLRIDEINRMAPTNAVRQRPERG